MTSKAIPMGYSANGAPTNPETSVRAIVSLVVGIVGVVCMGYFGIILGPIALCFGLAAKKNIQESEGRLSGDCMATAGVVLGTINIVIIHLKDLKDTLE